MEDQSKIVDLDAERVARTESKGEGPVVRTRGKDFQLSPEMPYAFVESMRALNKAREKDDGFAASEIMADVVAAMLGDQYDAFLATNPSIADVTALIEKVAPLYGTTTGESSASES